ncbi:MAG: hypothetical protein H7Z20_03650 [Bdellovibrio sp.]|nr:hypothetical protein [Methylotenera sp.]
MTVERISALAALLRHCEEVAQVLLADTGEFHPFGAYLNANGEIEALAAYNGTEHLCSSELYKLLHGVITKMANDRTLVAYAIAADVSIPSQFNSTFPDGIRVQVEAPGYSRDLYIPYRLLPMRALRKFFVVFPTVEYAEQIAVDVDPSVFTA